MPWSEGSTGEPSDTAGLSVQAAASNVEGRQTAVSGEVAWWTAVAPVWRGAVAAAVCCVVLVRPPTSVMGSPQKQRGRGRGGDQWSGPVGPAAAVTDRER